MLTRHLQNVECGMRTSSAHIGRSADFSRPLLSAARRALVSLEMRGSGYWCVYVSVCVRVCVRGCVRVCVCVWVCGCVGACVYALAHVRKIKWQ